MGRKILLVDDEPALGQMVAKHLVQAGYEVDTATCCAQALDIFNAAAPDAVLLDIMLPDGDGFSLFG
ncbi:MAG: response regulator, partial [Oscillospiraceae bacterium]|nr:response regulator [Oscillospiraceae bacterium]